MLDDSMDRNMSPVHGNSRHSSLSNLEKNCSQIFMKTPAITREFFEKINNDVVPQKTDVFGYEMNTRRFIVLTGLCLLFTLSTVGTITLWFTNAFQKRIDSMTVLTENSRGYPLWKSPPPKPHVRIYIFNYTNVDEFEVGRADKLNVEELGPYVYTEQLERINIRFNKVDGTVSYQEKRTYEFVPELSNGTLQDLVVVPNVPMLSGASVVKKLNFLMRLSYNGLLKALSEKPFLKLKAGSFVNGYDDHLYDLSKSYLKFEDKRIFENFGLLVWKQGTQPDIYTMNTGAHDINKLGQLEKFNGQSHYDIWGSESCNRIQASDGTIFPKNLVAEQKDLEFFIPQMCRKVPMKFAGETRILDKVPAYRYKMPVDVFDSVENKENECYCTRELGTCPQHGLFNATACTFGAPLFFSWPHFVGADPAVQDGVTGLNKHHMIDDVYATIHPKFGTTLAGKMKMQVNVQLQKSFGLSELNRYPDGLMLPLVWVEEELNDNDLPDEVVHLIYQITFTVRNLEIGLKYGCLLATMVTLTSIFLVFKRHRESRSRVDSIRSNMTIVDP